LLYLSEGKSFAGTSTLVQLGDDCWLSKTAVYKRIRNSGEWLRWLCENFYRHAGLLVERPAWLEGRDVYLVEGSEVVTRGNEKSYYMLHYCLDLFTLGMKEFHITGMEGGEKLSNFSCFGGNDIVVGDRVYGRQPGIRYLRGLRAGYVWTLPWAVANRVGVQTAEKLIWVRSDADEGGSQRPCVVLREAVTVPFVKRS
jgi:hypothetical protein